MIVKTAPFSLPEMAARRGGITIGQLARQVYACRCFRAIEQRNDAAQPALFLLREYVNGFRVITSSGTNCPGLLDPLENCKQVVNPSLATEATTEGGFSGFLIGSVSDA